MTHVPRQIIHPSAGESATSGGDALREGGVLEEVSFLGAVNTLLRRRALIAGLAVSFAAVLALYALAKQRTYSSTSSFMPEARSTSTGLSGIAAQFGVTIPGQEGTESSQFYVDLLHSRRILGAAVDTKYRVASDRGAQSENLVSVYDAKGKNPGLRRDAAMARLNRSLTTSISAKTNVVTIGVTASDPVVARDINQRLISLLSEFNLSQRQSRARTEREFTEQRLADVRSELRTVEDRLQVFLQENRVYNTAPALQFQRERLQADVDVRRQLVTVLQQAVEQARIEEVRDTPVITSIEAPDVPVRPDGRGTIKLALLGLFLGMIIGIGIAFVKDVGDRPDVKESEEFEEFRNLRRAALADLTHPWRPFARALRRG